MNEINAAQRKRVAAQELAEADKIKIVTAAEAEAEAEKDRLHGVGIAQQRKAIVDGLAESIAELKEAEDNYVESKPKKTIVRGCIELAASMDVHNNIDNGVGGGIDMID